MQIDIDKLQEDYRKIAEQRAANGAFELEEALKHCAGEVVEAAQEEVDYQEVVESNNEDAKRYYKLSLTLELADVVYCAMTCASNNGIKFSDILHEGYKKEKARAELKGDKV